jgi:hypothetical protein
MMLSIVIGARASASTYEFLTRCGRTERPQLAVVSIPSCRCSSDLTDSASRVVSGRRTWTYSRICSRLAPTRCAGCDMPGALLCRRECARALPRIDRRWACPRCGAPFGYLTCTECWSAGTVVRRSGVRRFSRTPALPVCCALQGCGGERASGTVLGECWPRRRRDMG